ncbi:interferon-induced GTP-binding protein Mx [Thraustotheca clavata]|uniref:Interferon-induced GTP-binding protein Mx n=1 Tax=Thraustotheca clavata TaxID=74557 RepID=A0A1W0AA25_9STRA|nr:interferon-induced GTP-binding protein Mx [Thraustotheca clavata]
MSLFEDNDAHANSGQLGLYKYIELPLIAVTPPVANPRYSRNYLELHFHPNCTVPNYQLILTYAKELTGTVRLARYESNELTTPTPITTLEEITQSIERITQQLQYISDDAIKIKMQGPNLTLTDLPGLVRTVDDGGDEGMIKRVRKLVDRFLVQERTIMLVVVPANLDMHNTEIMQTAGAEDAVINLLMNRTKKRRLGYHVVKCRGQHALNTSVSISDGRKDEETYFATDPVWKSVDASLCVTERLADKLSKLLIETIASAMPAVFAEIDSQMKACQYELESMGPLMDNASARRSLYMQHVRVILNRIEWAKSGQYNDDFFHGKGNADCLWTRLRKLEATFMNRIITLAKKWDQSNRVPKVSDLVEIRQNGIWVIDEVYMYWTIKLQPTIIRKIGLKRGSWRFPKQTDVDGIMELINENRGNEVSILSYPIFCNIVVQGYVSKWKVPMFDLYETYQLAIEEVVECAIDSTKARLLLTIYIKLRFNFNIRRIAHTTFHRRHWKCSGGDDNTQVSIGMIKSDFPVELHMALRTYMAVAKKRFIDIVPMKLEMTFPLLKELTHRFTTSNASDETLSKLLWDSIADIQKRNELEAKLEALKYAKSIITNSMK